MIPAVGAHGWLPVGIHPATWAEFEARYGGPTLRRKRLARGLFFALGELRAAGCPRAYVGGSFVTDVPEPNDVDCCFDYDHDLDWPRLAAADLLSTANECAAQRARYGCEFHFANMAIGLFGPVQGSMTFLEFYQHNADGERIGIVALDLRSLP